MDLVFDLRPREGNYLKNSLSISPENREEIFASPVANFKKEQGENREDRN